MPGNALASWIPIAAAIAGVVLLGILPQIFYSLQPYLAAP
jgi:hypothetical protein